MIRSGFLFWLKAATLLISHPTDLSNVKKTSVPWSPTARPKERLSFLSPLLLHLGQGLLSFGPSPLSPKLHLLHRPKSSRTSNPLLCSQSETEQHRELSSIWTQPAVAAPATLKWRIRHRGYRQLWTQHGPVLFPFPYSSLLSWKHSDNSNKERENA